MIWFLLALFVVYGLAGWNAYCFLRQVDPGEDPLVSGLAAAFWILTSGRSLWKSIRRSA